MTHKPIHIIGGGLAGSEAAWQIASVGVPVPSRTTACMPEVAASLPMASAIMAADMA